MNRPLLEGWGQLLSRFLWDWFLTLTYRDEVKSFRAHRLYQVFVREIEKAAGLPIFWFRADEIGPHGGRFHIHALIGNVAHLRRMFWVDRWNELAGFARILPFDARRGAAHYVAKYVVKQFGDWQLSDDLRAFREYQPILELPGSIKPPAVKTQAEPAVKDMPKSLIIRPGQYLLPALGSKRAQPGRSQLISEVYRSEVTKGRGRFREFFLRED
jgi:hypothetical protein